MPSKVTVPSPLQLSIANPARESMKSCLCLTLVLLTAGCAGYWGRHPVDEGKAIDKDDPVWIWIPGRVEKWHWVVITRDSISGVPWKSRWCRACVHTIPRVQVDSMKLGYRTFDEKLVEGLGGVAASVALWVALCTVFGTRSGDAPCGGGK